MPRDVTNWDNFNIFKKDFTYNVFINSNLCILSFYKVFKLVFMVNISSFYFIGFIVFEPRKFLVEN